MLEFQGRRHAVRGLRRVVFRVLPVLVQIDEPWRNCESPGIEGLLSLQGTCRNHSNLSPADPQTSRSVQARLRIHHSSTRDDDFIRFVFSQNGFVRAHAGAKNQQRRSRERRPPAHRIGQEWHVVPHPLRLALSLFVPTLSVKGFLNRFSGCELASAKSRVQRETPDRWGERPGVGVLLRGAGGNSFLSNSPGVRPACRSAAALHR